MKSFVWGILIAVVLVGGGFVLLRGNDGSVATVASDETSNVSVVDGTQIVTIKAKGGYQPVTSTVKAGVPTVLRFETSGTFDCSSSVRIPSLNISRILPSTGTTDIAIGALQPGTFQGTCSMGMYRFDLNVRS